MADHSQDWNKLAEVGRYAEAIALCTHTVHDLDNNCRAMEVLGYCHHQIGDPAQALKYFDRALALGSADFYTRLFRARSLEGVGNYASALEQDLATLATWPDLAGQVLPHAVGLLSQLAEDEASQHLKSALTRWLDEHGTIADRSQAWNKLAEIGRYAEAIALCTRTAQDLDNNCRAMEVLGYCYHQIGEPTQALQYFDRALALGSEDFYTRLFRARSLEGVGNHASALEQDLATLETWPDLAGHVLPHAVGLLSQLANAETLERLKRALTQWLDKHGAIAEHLLIWSKLAEIGRYAEAIALSARTAHDLDNNCRAMEVLGYCHHQIGEPAQALRYFNRALALGSADFYTWLFRARSLESVGNYESALEQDLATLETWPGLAENILPHAIGLLSQLADDESSKQLKTALTQWLGKHRAEPQWRLRSLFLCREDQELRHLLEADPISPPNFHFCSIVSTAGYAERYAGSLQYTGVAETIRIAPPHDVREAATPPRFVQGNAPYVAELKDVQIVGGSSLVFGGPDAVVSDALADPEFGRYVSLRADPCFVEKRVDAALISLPQSTQLITQGLHLAGLASDQFGHWFAEFLPKLRHFETLPGYSDIPIIVDDGMPASHYDFLSLLSRNPIICIPRAETATVGRLFVAPTTTFFPIELSAGHNVPSDRQASWSADAMRFVRARVLAHFGQESERKRMIYLSRRRSTWRRLINEVEIENTLTDIGFEVVLLEDHSFREQVRIFQEAAFIVAPNASALNSLMFADTGVKALILAQRQQFNWGGWLGPMQDLGFAPRFFIGEAVGSADNKHADYLVSAENLRKTITQILEDGPIS